jgi:hypothetical protein
MPHPSEAVPARPKCIGRARWFGGALEDLLSSRQQV